MCWTLGELSLAWDSLPTPVHSLHLWGAKWRVENVGCGAASRILQEPDKIAFRLPSIELQTSGLPRLEMAGC